MRLHLLILAATVLLSTGAGCPPRKPEPIVGNIGAVYELHRGNTPSSGSLEKKDPLVGVIASALASRSLKSLTAQKIQTVIERISGM